MAEIIDGKLTSALTRDRIKKDAEAFSAEYGRAPSLAVILVGDDPASAVYVRNKHRGCLECGIRSLEFKYPADMTEDALLSKIDELNADPDVNGILVQLPLPLHISEEKVICRIAPEKDVDGFHPENVGHMVSGAPGFLPCTPAGIMELLKQYQVETAGKNCVIIGRSNIVGKPMFHLMLGANATVTVCHSKTQNLSSFTKNADILIVAIGRPNFVSADMVKPGAVVIDVGINRLPDGKLAGDVDFAAVSEVASKITPVPGGVGPMTITMLLSNTVTAARRQAKA